MKKRLSCFILAMAMLLSSIQVLAIKRTENPEQGGSGTNIAQFGSFNSEADLKHFGLSGANVKWSSDGATKAKGSVQVNVTSAWGYAYISVPYVAGETYDISFYARVDGATDRLEFIPMMDSGWDNTILNDTYTPDWKKYTCTYVCDGLNYKGEAATGAIRLFNVRRGSGDQATTYYLDEIEIKPRGMVEYDWTATIQKFSGAKEQVVIPADSGFATPHPVKTASFADTTGHWAETTINTLAAANYVQGMGNSIYAPENNVTRAEAMTMAMNLLRIDGTPYKGQFSDVKSTDWFASNLQTAVDIGLIDPVMTIGGKFRPNDAITREEAATLFAGVAKLKNEAPESKSNVFADDSVITAWAKEAVYDAVNYGILKGYPDGSFGPAKNITRAEAATMLYRTVELNSKFAVYVDAEKGNDKNDGSIEAPLKTIDAARKMVRPYLKDMQNHIFVYIKDGLYVVNKPIQFGVEDSGNNGWSVIYTSMGEEQPVLSSSKAYGDFQLYDEDKNIYRTYIGVGTETRQVYIDGIRGVRARSVIDVADADCALTNATKSQGEGWYISDDVEFLNYQNIEDIEFVYFEQWTNPRCHLQSVEETEDGKVKFIMNPTQWAPNTSDNTPWSYPAYIENAYELLDSKGEWYMNKVDGYLYYMPRDYENPETMKAYVATGEHAMIIAGNSSKDKIHNLKFENLAVEYFTWLWPSTASNAYTDGQGNHLSGYKGDGRLTGQKEDGAVIVADAAYIDIKDCTFSKLGAAGINFREIFQHCNVIGNHIYDVSGSGLNIGVAQGPEQANYNKYVNPKEAENFKNDNVIMNNYIHDVGVDYGSSVGINISWLQNSQVFHNEIYNVPYSGMHVGWGWAGYASQGTGTRNLDINYNYVHDTSDSYVYDAGSVYLLGATGGSEGDYNELNYNYFENHRNSYGCAYPDEGSTFWEITGNVVDLKEIKEWPRKQNAMDTRWLHIHINTIVNNYIHDNYSTTERYLNNSPNNKFENAQVFEDAQWPEEAQAIMDAAGLEPQYLEKYPDSIQRLRILNEEKKYFLKKGDTVQMDVVGYMRKLNEVKIPYSELDFYSTNTNVAVVDKNGLVTGVGAGKAAIYVEYLDKDVIRRKYIDIVCDDSVVEITSNVSSLNVLAGYEVTIAAEGKTRFGNIVTIDEAEYSVDDPSIVSVSNDGKVKGLTKGSTTVHAIYTADGVSLEKHYPVSVISYVTEDSIKHLENSRKMGADFFTPSRWNHSTSAAEGGGMKVKGAQPAYYNTRIGNELISFDMRIDPEGYTWPSLAIRNARPMEDYSSSDCYMMGFKKDIIEVQRFNNGKRTMIFGGAEFNPVGGPGYPNKLEDGGGQLFEYGKVYSITVGALDEENGTRLVLIINDKPIFDFVDNAEGYISGEGLFGIYSESNKQGSFTLYPFSGKTYDAE